MMKFILVGILVFLFLILLVLLWTNKNKIASKIEKPADKKKKKVQKTAEQALAGNFDLEKIVNLTEKRPLKTEPFVFLIFENPKDQVNTDIYITNVKNSKLFMNKIPAGEEPSPHQFSLLRPKKVAPHCYHLQFNKKFVNLDKNNNAILSEKPMEWKILRVGLEEIVIVNNHGKFLSFNKESKDSKVYGKTTPFIWKHEDN